MLHLLLFNESFGHYLSIICVTIMVFYVWMNDAVHLLYITSACGEASWDEL